MVMFSHYLIFLKPSPRPQNRLRKSVSYARKQNNTRTAVPVRKGKVLASCGIPSRITCNEITPGTRPWYISYVHPKKEGYKGKTWHTASVLSQETWHPILNVKLTSLRTVFWRREKGVDFLQKWCIPWTCSWCYFVGSDTGWYTEHLGSILNFFKS